MIICKTNQQISELFDRPPSFKEKFKAAFYCLLGRTVIFNTIGVFIFSMPSPKSKLHHICFVKTFMFPNEEKLEIYQKEVAFAQKEKVHIKKK